jgi:2'-5' RNA ligase
MARSIQRLFVSLAIPAGEKKKIHRVAGVLRDGGMPVRWIDPTLYHITMKFLGDVPSEKIETISEALLKVAKENHAFEAELQGFGAFPTLRKPKVLWLGVKPTPPLRCLKHDVEWALSQVGFEREARAFHPHLTLGRVGDDGVAGAFRGLDQVAADLEYHGSFPVATVNLMSTRFSKTGPQYSVVSKSKLN